MVSRGGQRRKDRPSDPFGTSGASPLFKLSATMVELSLRHKISDLDGGVPVEAQKKLDSYSSEARGQLISNNRAGNIKEKERQAVQFDQSQVVPTRRELLRTSVSRINHQSVKTFEWLRSRLGIVALALLALSLVLAFRHQVKNQSPTPAMLQQRQGAPVPSVASQNIHKHARAIPPQKPKSRRHQSDYIAKDTYISFDKDGKPSK
jgi:hypothetical protein